MKSSQLGAMLCCAIVTLGLSVSDSKAILVDPGPIGGPANLSFIETFAQFEAGVDITFPDMKHVELFGTSLFISIELAGGIEPLGVLSLRQSGNLIYRYLDENGDTIGDIGGGTWSTSFDSTPIDIFPSGVVNPVAPNPFVIHDLYIQLEDFGAAINPDTTQLQVTITWPNDTLVGEGLSTPTSTNTHGTPEPVTAMLGLMGLGALGVAARRRMA